MHQFACLLWCLRLFLLSTLLFLPFTSAIKFQNLRSSNQAKSRLVLFRGHERVEIEGKACPVGISFTEPLRFSCACVTGVWAFYDEWCAPPFRVIGGINHCFEMTNNWVQQVTLWSNPIKVQDNTLTIFEGDEEYIKAKVYRNTHINFDNVSSVVTHNSAWTLTSQKDGARVCLNSEVRAPVGLKHAGTQEKTVFCHFEGVGEHLSVISGFKPGCAGNDTRVQPTRCQRYENTNDEEFCTSPGILGNYKNWESEEAAAKAATRNRTVRTFRKRIRSRTSTTTTTTEAPPTTTIPPTPNLEPDPNPISNLKPLLFDAEMFQNEYAAREAVVRGKKATSPEIVQSRPRPRLFLDFPDNPYDGGVDSGSAVGVDGGESGRPDGPSVVETGNLNYDDFPSNIDRSKAILIDFAKNIGGGEGGGVKPVNPPVEGVDGGTTATVSVETTNKENDTKKIEDMINEMNKINESDWLTPAKSESDPFFLIQVWMYQKQAILTALDLKREEELVEHASNQVGTLLNISKTIMQITCGELVTPEFFNMGMETFLNVQRKNMHWKLPFVDHNDYLRIQASLLNCLSRAQKFTFKSTTHCLIKDPPSVVLNGVDKPLIVPDRLNSTGFEPIIESMWKVIVNAHSYCYADFSESYNDHHRYTVMFTPIFTNGIHDIWYRNKTLEEEYSGVAGKLNLFLREIDKCTTASRYVSAYPWDLARPIAGDNEEHRRRRKRAIRSGRGRFRSTTPPSPTDPEVLRLARIRKEEAAWRKNRLILRGLGYCLKKFDEPRTRLGQECAVESESS